MTKQLLAIILSLIASSGYCEGFNGYKWGTPIDQVKKTETDAPSFESATELSYRKNEEGVEVAIEYSFDLYGGLQLGIISYDFGVGDEAYKASMEVTRKRGVEYTKLFGKPTKRSDDRMSNILYWDRKKEIIYIERATASGIWLFIVHADKTARAVFEKRFGKVE